MPYCPNCSAMTDHFIAQCPKVIKPMRRRDPREETTEHKISSDETSRVTKRHCPTCRCHGPKTHAERQKAYRQRKGHTVAALLLIWMLRWFNTADDLLNFLQGLSPETAKTAKVIVAPSNRNYFGFGGNPYGLIYWQGK